MESLQAAEARACLLGSRVRNKLLDKIRVLQRLLLEIRRQDNALLWEMSERPLRWAQKAEALLVQRVAGAWAAWRKGVLRHSLTNRLPRCLESLRHLSQQLQQELKRPLATLAGAYQDATGRRLDATWKETVVLWSRKLAEQLPAVLEEHQLGAPLRAALGALTAALDLVSQQMAQWAESRLGAALVGIRRRLASLYKLSHGRCEVSVQLPLPRGAWSDVGGAGMVEFLLDEWLLRPMVTVASLRPAAELYRLKRRMMESPFNHQALLVSDQFALSFDGRLYELPGRCPLLLARDLMGGSFTMVLSPNTAPERTLLVEMSNTTVSISPHGQVEMNCRETDESFSDSGVSVRRDGVLIQVSNQNGALLSCDLSQEVCSLTLDGWQHGVSMGLLGTNDNEAGNELTLPDGSQADGEDHFLQSWQLKPHCRRGPCSNTSKAEATSDLLSCASLFSDLDSPLGSCFRVVDPGQFLAVCERSRCHRGSAPCRLAAAFVHLCRRNYVPLDLPELCVSV
ncbi:apolipophorins-like [Scleropages formosus]|uniref:apolipophorins-like n=1 Tax=Scleropages formosus TaxID=113540 RepID=UPI000878A276|nr:apolipophorins-like [Scleropages formosus]